jgi:hypothetical protein
MSEAIQEQKRKTDMTGFIVMLNCVIFKNTCSQENKSLNFNSLAIHLIAEKVFNACSYVAANGSSAIVHQLSNLAQPFRH